ncbi:MAG: roadblock/LC7 domain-containing protein [Candidatus Jordarchaeales archaeon]
MAEDVRKRLVNVLKELERRVADVLGSAVVSSEGMLVASDLPSEVADPRLVAAMAVATLGIGKRTVAELGQGMLQRVLITGSGGQTVVMSVGEEHLLTVLVRSDANLGLVFWEMEKAIEEIKKLLY